MSKLNEFYKELEELIDRALSFEDDDPTKEKIFKLAAISPETEPKVKSLLVKISKELGIDLSLLIGWYKGCSEEPKPINCLKQKVQAYKVQQQAQNTKQKP
ncbi:hypothetical protein Q9F35_005238 [Vibrio harveyi]|nr:hypothetical protein [Vibrio harveyi]